MVIEYYGSILQTFRKPNAKDRSAFFTSSLSVSAMFIITG